MKVILKRISRRIWDWYLCRWQKYEGQWKNGKWEGNGKTTWKDGATHEGQWMAGKANGNGTKIFNGGDKYTGEWKDDKINGEGVYTWKTVIRIPVALRLI